jgi:hypothetical protein
MAPAWWESHRTGRDAGLPVPGRRRPGGALNRGCGQRPAFRALHRPPKQLVLKVRLAACPVPAPMELINMALAESHRSFEPSTHVFSWWARRFRLSSSPSGVIGRRGPSG